MLVPASYQVPEKKAKKKKGKEAKGGPHHKGPSDTVSGETEALSSHEGDEEEEEEEEEVESDSPHKGRKKRVTSEDPKGEVPKRGKASLLVATAQAAEVSELNRKLKVANEEIDRINKRFNETQVGATEVETLKGALTQAKKEVEANKAAADKAAAELKTEQATRRQHEARVAEVEQELKDAIGKCEALEEKTSALSTELAKAFHDAKAARVESRSARKEIHQAKQIAAVLPSPGGEFDQEVVLVAISRAEAPDASERPAEADNGAA
nr:neurofilament medium polypeptide-like [Aegilops tauschii subsp. strangulata]